MAGDEHEPQQVIADDILGARLHRAAVAFLLHFKLVPERLMLTRQHAPPPQLIDGAVLGGRHQPGTGVVGNAVLRPVLERSDERILRQLLRQPDVAQHAREAGDESRGLDAPHGIDGAMGIRSLHDCG